VRHRSRAVRPLIASLVVAAVSVAAAPEPAPVSAVLTNLRSAKGHVLACLTARADAFPDCAKDPLARKLTVPAAPEVHLDFGSVPAGQYAVSVIHDENGNGKLDTSLMIPREGYGFSRDAPVRMGPPKFDSAAFAVAGEPVHLAIRMRYLL